MPDTGACRKRQIPGCRILSHLPTPGLLIEALKRILEAEAGTSGHRCFTRVANALAGVAPDPATRPLGFLTYADLTRRFGFRRFEVCFR
jgi:hypothetical protein